MDTTPNKIILPLVNVGGQTKEKEKERRWSDSVIDFMKGDLYQTYFGWAVDCFVRTMIGEKE